MSTSKEKLANTISDMVSNLLYYDRREDEDLTLDEMNNLINSHEVDVNWIVAQFEKELERALFNRGK